jgi:protein involved in polysaccharide export with SLBB domain
MMTRLLLFIAFFLASAAGAWANDTGIDELAMGKAPQRVVVSEVEAAEPAVANDPKPLGNVEVTNDGPIVVAPQNVSEEPCIVPDPTGYAIGVADLLTVNVVRPEPLLMDVTVSPDGTISFPYIGTVVVKGKTLDQVQSEMTKKLGEGYMKYPVLSVTLKESNSKRFFVYGEVTTPGPYAVEENMTVLRAISMAGGFSKFGSSSRVKVLRPRSAGRGYEPIKINIKEVMDGHVDADTVIKPGDIVVVSEGVF